MANREAEGLTALYRCWAAALAADPEMPLDELRLMFEHWGDVDMECTGETLVSNRDKDAIVKKETVETIAAAFLGPAGHHRDPLANPPYAELAGLPPIFIQVRGDETLLDDSRRLAERARQAGVDVMLDIVPGMQHVFHFAAGRLPAADEAIGRLGRWVRPKLGLA